MKLTILGSGTNMHPKRAAAGYLVQTDHLIMLDFGPRTLSNLQRMGVDRHRIQYILFSHFHADHFSDFITFFFDAVFYSKFIAKRPSLTVIGPRGTRALFRTMLRTFPGFNAGTFPVRFREVADRSFWIGQTKVIPRTVTHSPHLHCVGYRLEYEGNAIAYSGDSQYCPNLVHLCRDVDAAVLDCSFPANRPGPGHMHAGECGQVAQEAGVSRLILSHFYPIAERFDVKRQAGKHYRGKITLGQDRMILTL